MVNQVEILRQKVGEQTKDPKNLLFLTMFTIGIASILAQLAQSTAATAPIIGPILSFLFKGVQPGLLGFGVILRWIVIVFIVVAMVNFIYGLVSNPPWFNFSMYGLGYMFRIVLAQTFLVGILVYIIILLPALLPGLYKQAVLQTIIGG